MNDLQLGDVLLKQYYGGLLHWVIREATSVEGSSSQYVHAAMYLEQGAIAESIGAGYSITQLMNQGKNYVYNVYRYDNPDLAGIAGHIISTWVRMKRDDVPGYSGGTFFGRYGLGQAVTGAAANIMDRNVRAGAKEGKAFWGSDNRPGVQSSYCSQFVVQAYNAAGATAQPPLTPINLAADRATPALLHDTLITDGAWTQLSGTLICR